ncbi:MAG: DUF6602 domain-containing protein [Pyrinomonadaceae bacterium]
MSKKFTVPDLLASVAERMWASFSERLIPHPHEFGTNREEVVREFLSLNLPKRLGVSTGFVFDSTGTVSKQMDVVIYDCDNCPRFETVGGKYFFPCEAVVAVGQVKSRLDSKRQFISALENLHSVKALDRSADGANFDRRDQRPLDQINVHIDQIFSFVFVIDHCIGEELLRKTLFEHLARHERWLWPNVIYYFDKYLVTFSCGFGVCPNPLDAFAISVVEDKSRAELLLYFYRFLAMAASVTTVGSFSYLQYLESDQEWDFKSYAFQDAPIKGKLPEHLTSIEKPVWDEPHD